MSSSRSPCLSNTRALVMVRGAIQGSVDAFSGTVSGTTPGSPGLVIDNRSLF